jgi:hypothetical protein
MPKISTTQGNGREIALSRQQGSSALFGSLTGQHPAQRQVCGQRDFAILPRRKATDQNPVGRAPVLLTKQLLEKYFGMSLSSASKELVSSLSCIFRQQAGS